MAIDRQNYCGIALPLPAHADLIQPFRQAHIATPATAVKMHITLVSPFVNGADLNEAHLARLAAFFAAAAPFNVMLAGFGRFPGVLYLTPEPTAPLLALTAALLRAFPGAAPDFPEHVFHATLAQGSGLDLDAVEAAFVRAHGALLPIRERIDHAVLYEKRAGVWSVRATFAFEGEPTGLP